MKKKEVNGAEQRARKLKRIDSGDLRGLENISREHDRMTSEVFIAQRKIDRIDHLSKHEIKYTTIKR